MKIEHNSQSEIFRNPFGAVTVGTAVRLRIGVADMGIPDYVRLWYIWEDKKSFADMVFVYEACGICMYEYEIEVPQNVGLLHYYFELSYSGKVIFYANNSQNFGGKGEICQTPPKNLYQITVYAKNYETPEWFKECIVYQIFPDRFSNGAENGEFLSDNPDFIKRKWGETPFYKAEQFGGEYLSNDIFGGNLKGIENKLSYLKNLGVGAIYLNPVFESASNHKYNTGDYMKIDSSFGTNEDFSRLCKKAKKFGIRIILDGVFNHTGSNSIYFNKYGKYTSQGAYQSKKSPYYDWFCFSEWPDSYDSWWGMDSLPSVNEKTKTFRDFIINSDNSVIKYWLRQGASGWRLDVADELPDFFIKEIRTAVKGEKKDAVIIGEVWEDASNKISYDVRREYLFGYELDSVMNYPLRNALIDFAKNKIDAAQFDKRIMSIKENYPKVAYYSLLNILSTHDTERILTALSTAPDKNSQSKDAMADFRLTEEERNKAVARLRQVVFLQMLMPGVPCIYYGDEAGTEGYADPFCRGCFEWDNIDKKIQEYFTKAIKIRKSSEAFTKGEFESVYALNRGYAFLRAHGGDKYIVCVNFCETEDVFRLDVARFEISHLQSESRAYHSDNGIFYIGMSKNGIEVFKSI